MRDTEAAPEAIEARDALASAVRDAGRLALPKFRGPLKSWTKDKWKLTLFGEVINLTNRKNYLNSSVWSGDASLARDNGCNASAEYKPPKMKMVDLEVDYSRSVPLRLNSEAVSSDFCPSSGRKASRNTTEATRSATCSSAPETGQPA